MEHIAEFYEIFFVFSFQIAYIGFLFFYVFFFCFYLNIQIVYFRLFGINILFFVIKKIVVVIHLFLGVVKFFQRQILKLFVFGNIAVNLRHLVVYFLVAILKVFYFVLFVGNGS